MVSKHRLAICILILLLLLTATCSCSSTEPAPLPKKDVPVADIKVTEVVHSLVFLPLYTAIELGYFRDEGLNVSLETAWDSNTGYTKLFNGETHLLLAGPELSFYYLQQKKKQETIHLAQLIQKNGHMLVARKAEEPFHWQKLKGKVVIGESAGSLPEMIFEQTLRKQNLKPLINVHIIQNLNYKTFTGTYRAGTGDYLLAMEPWASGLEKENAGLVVSSADDFPDALPYATVMATPEYVKKHSALCQKFLNAYWRGLHWTNMHSPEELQAIAQKYFPQEKESTLLRGISRYKTLGLWPDTPLVSETGMEKIQKLMLESKELNAKLNINGLIDNTFARKALDKYRTN
ncbi:MAG: ABC transporter substrate-binding protein [Bacillota bacterium]|nr:ABC transporter substrate-binding protein [Thermanaerosceptrum fracticalcis]